MTQENNEKQADAKSEKGEEEKIKEEIKTEKEEVDEEGNREIKVSSVGFSLKSNQKKYYNDILIICTKQ